MTERPHSTPTAGVHHIDALPPGARLAEFEILGLLGVGGFGMVYQAFDHSLHRTVAIKEYMPAALSGRSEGQSLSVRSSSDLQTFQAGLTSFVAEARMLAQFDHPSLVKVFRFWQANNTAYMVMPLYAGMTLKQARSHMRNPPPEAWLRKMLWSVLGALRVLHERKTLHRDISPDNIFLQDNGPPVLLDLGAARHAISEQDRKHTAVLKVNYAPIEQFAEGGEDLRPGPWSDLYSLAAVVYGCVCNDTPVPATMRTMQDNMVPFPVVAQTVQKQFGVDYSMPFVTAIEQALALRPQERPQNIDAFLQAMAMTSPPPGDAHFDFRAELGDAWQTPADHPDTAAATVHLTVATQRIQGLPHDTEPASAQLSIDVGESVFEAHAPDLPAPPQRRRRPAWLAGLVAVVLLMGGGWWWMQGRSAPRPVDDIITELKEPQAAAPEPAAPASAPASAATAASSAAASAPLDTASARTAARASATRRHQPEPAPSAPATVQNSPPPPPDPAPAVAKPKEEAVRVAGPQEACADASFLARPMCIFNQCQKPALAGHPVCVDVRRRQEAEEARRQLQN